MGSGKRDRLARMITAALAEHELRPAIAFAPAEEDDGIRLEIDIEGVASGIAITLSSNGCSGQPRASGGGGRRDRGHVVPVLRLRRREEARRGQGYCPRRSRDEGGTGRPHGGRGPLHRCRGVSEAVRKAGFTPGEIRIAARAWFPGPTEPGYTVVGEWGGAGDGPGSFDGPIGLAVAGHEVFVADFGHDRVVRMIQDND